MFDDIITKPKDGFSWDFEKYEDKPYCPICGCEDLTILRDHLSSKKLVKEVRCNFCGAEWREEWDKDIDLKLKEVSICRGDYVVYYQSGPFFVWGFSLRDAYLQQKDVLPPIPK